MQKWLIVPLALLLAACGGSPSPDNTPSPSETPTVTASSTPIAGDVCDPGGVVYCVMNPDVTFDTRGSTICVSGWTSTIRPPASYTTNLKIQQMQAEGLPGTTANYEEDHRLPLEGGGNPTDPNNLSPESRSGQGGVSGSVPSSVKDQAENQLKSDLCAASDPQQFHDLQAAFVLKWLKPYPAYP